MKKKYDLYKLADDSHPNLDAYFLSPQEVYFCCPKNGDPHKIAKSIVDGYNDCVEQAREQVDETNDVKLPNNLNKSIVLRMDAKFQPEITRGVKTVTTRKGHRTEFKIGESYKIEWTHSFEGPMKPTYIRVKRIDFRRLIHIDDELAELAAHVNADNYRESISYYYPNISSNDVVTSIYFEVV